MWSTIANFRENLSQIASDVLDTAEELETGGSRHGSLDDLEFLAVRRQQQDAKHQDELLMLREENKILKKKMALLVAERVPLLNGDVKKQHEFQESTEDFNNGLHTRNQNENDGQQVGRRHNMSGSGGHQQPYSEASGDQMSNGITSLGRFQQLELQVRKLQDIEKDLSTQISEKNQKYALLKDAHDLSLTEIKTLKEVLEKERADLANTKLQLQREQKAVEALENESKRWKMEKRKMSLEIAELQKRSEEQTASNEHTINYLQSELRKKTGESFAGNNEKMEQLQKTIDRLENEKCELQVEIENLLQRQTQDLRSPRVEERKANGLSHEELNKEAEGFKEAEVAFDVKRREIEVRFDDIRAERDKALRDLSRLKQHLLEKEQADSEKMDQDCEHIAELEAKAEASNARVLQLEQTVSQMLAYQAAVHKENNEILQKNNEEIASLKQRLSNCIAVLESKDVELLNLQTVLGQYYAESEAKDRLLGELNVTKKEISLLSEKLKVANRNMELKNKEKEDVVASLTSQERKVIESQQKTSKLEEEVLMLRRALEQSLTRLNRMSSDSDYYVDRRIVIKLLVTYFQRHHSKEVLDLMVRMLGFSEEDKQAIGLAQQGAGKGVVRGVLGLPGRFVGGLLKNGSPESSSSLLQTGNQSFADLWIDFLLKESEERERRDMTAEVKLESGKQTVASTSPAYRSQESSPVHSARGAPLLTSQPGSSSYVAEPVNRTLFSSDLNDTAGGEFSTVPLNSTPSPKASSLRQWRTNIHL